MSYVDNVILSWSILENEDERISEINAWMRDNAGGQQFVDVTAHPEAYGGAKYLETTLLMGAFNYMPEEEFLQFLRTLPWRDPTDVQYIVKRQESDRFEIEVLGPPSSSRDCGDSQYESAANDDI
jgi:hypothetical protein